MPWHPLLWNAHGVAQRCFFSSKQMLHAAENLSTGRNEPGNNCPQFLFATARPPTRAKVTRSAPVVTSRAAGYL